MSTQQLKAEISAAVAGIPTKEELRLRIAQNMQERDLLRQLIKIVDRRAQLADLESRKGAGR